LSNHYYSTKPRSRIKKGLIKTTLRGKEYTFLTASGIFSYRRIDKGTRLLVESMKIPKKGTIIDLGCGIGVIGLVAASENPDLYVVLSDVNPRATQIAAENVKLMGLENAEVVTGVLYKPVNQRVFDAIITNPPVSASMSKVVKPLVMQAPKHLKPQGFIQLVVQTNKGGNTLAGYLDTAFGSHMVVSKQGGYRVLFAKKRDSKL
jgi:16S rRNA G1207 methylase RsmC